MLNALQALADPTDDLALAGLLRSPALGLSDEALYRLQQVRQQTQTTSLWAVLPQPIEMLSSEDQQRQARAMGLMMNIRQIENPTWPCGGWAMVLIFGFAALYFPVFSL